MDFINFEGKVLSVDKQRGHSQSTNKDWVKTTIVVKENETGKFSSTLQMYAFDDLNVEVGCSVKLSFIIQSREYQGKYFTELKIGSFNAFNFPVKDETPNFVDEVGGSSDDLPF